MEPLRFTDVLTMASAVANYLGAEAVTAAHVLDAIAVLGGEKRMEDLGRPLSPLVRRREAGADPAVRALAQRWWADLGGSPEAELDEASLARLTGELRALRGG